MPPLLPLLVLVLIELHGPTGQIFEINPAAISSLRQPLVPKGNKGHWIKNVHCVVVTTYGGSIAVAEDCATVENKLR